MWRITNNPDIASRLMKLSAIYLVGSLALFSLPMKVKAQVSCNSSDIRKVNDTLAMQFPDFRVVNFNDLIESDQKDWVKRSLGKCPGLASGNFDGSGIQQQAILMISKSDPRQRRRTLEGQVVLLVYIRDPNKITLKTLEKIETPVIPVIYALPPARYQYYKETSEFPEKIEIKTELLVMESIGASAIGYSLQNSQVRRFPLSR